MKFIAFGLILICCHVWAIETNVELAKRTKLEQFLEGFKTTLRNGDSKLGIPVLDPFTLSELPINLNLSDIKFEGVVTNARVDGLSEYTVNSANFKVIGLKMNMDLTWPLVTASTNYTMKASVAGVDVYGTGDANMVAQNFNFATQIAFSLKGNHIQIKSMSTRISLGGFDFHVTGLYDNDETSAALSKTISELMPQFIKDYQKTIVDTFNGIVTKMGNEILSKITFKDLMKMLGL